MSDEPTTEPFDGAQEPPTRPLFVVKGDATPEEVAALVAVLHGLGSAAEPAPEPPKPEWSAHHRKVRTAFRAGSGGWRSSSLPR